MSRIVELSKKFDTTKAYQICTAMILCVFATPKVTESYYSYNDFHCSYLELQTATIEWLWEKGTKNSLKTAYPGMTIAHQNVY